MILLGVLGFLILVFLPGAWLAFGLPFGKRSSGDGLDFGQKLLIGAALSPLVICLQFYTLRLLGAPFQAAAVLLPLLNLPALLVMFSKRHRGSTPGQERPAARFRPDWHVLGGALILFSIFLITIYPQLIYPSIRQFTGHGWYFSAPMYQIANGGLLLQDPDLAGMRLAYPWGGIVYQAILSYLLDSPPMVSFIWTNLAWLMLIYAILIWVVKELGGGRFAQVSALIWLSLGVNFGGYLLGKLATSFEWNLPNILGDPRYSPWLIKFLFLQQEPLTLGIFIAVLFLMVKEWNGKLPLAVHILLVCLLCEIALIQTIYVPAAAALLGAKIIALSLAASCPRRSLPSSRTSSIAKSSATSHASQFERFKAWGQSLPPDVFWLAVDILIAGGFTVLYVQFITRDRAASSVGFFGPANLDGLKILILRITTCLVALSILLIGWMAYVRKLWASHRQATIVLTLGAIASCALTILLFIPGFSNEYKFLFTAAICLAPFPALAFESWANRSKKLAFPIYILLTAILIIPLAQRMIHGWPWWAESGLVSPPPKTDFSHFSLQLQAGEPYADLVEAIRARAPKDAILVIQDPEQYLPLLTQRAMYVASEHKRSYAGVNIPMQFMLWKVKGYDRGTIEARWQELEQLFQSQEASQKEQALQRMLSLKSPLAIILRTDRDVNLQDWLEDRQAGRIIYQAGGYMIWLILPQEQS